MLTVVGGRAASSAWRAPERCPWDCEVVRLAAVGSKSSNEVVSWYVVPLREKGNSSLCVVDGGGFLEGPSVKSCHPDGAV